jgi:hypothetical protein
MTVQNCFYILRLKTENESNGSLPNSDFVEILQDVFLIPRTAIQNL